MNPVHTEQQPQPFACAKCGTMFGTFAAGVLNFGGFSLSGPIKVRCLSCGWVTKWRPHESAPDCVDPVKRAE